MYPPQTETVTFNYEFPECILAVLLPPKRWKVLYGGRGSAKSWSVARQLLIRGATEKLRILCAREIQASIKDSVHKLLSDQIIELGLQAYYIVQETSIRSVTGTEFIFKGLRNNADEIKSTEGIDICWIEEAEVVSQTSWDVLEPTIRREVKDAAGNIIWQAEIWVTFNPKDEKSATYQMFVVNCPDDCLRAEVNYWHNPWFPDVLRRAMEYCKRVDYEKYLHVWEGKPEKYGNALIFRGKFSVRHFDIPDDVERFYYGLDFGFSTDPLSFHRYFIRQHEDGKRLYIANEFYGHGIELEEMIPGIDPILKLNPAGRQQRITADSARPDTISYLKRQGLNIVGAEKGPGSVEDGITFLQSFVEIVIHPDCKGAKNDFENYRYKEDKNTGEVIPVPVDKSNHTIDEARYALEKLIKQKRTVFDVL